VDEFQLIDRFFRRPTLFDNVKVGIGDDGAVLKTRSKQDLVVVTDTLVEGIHFCSEISPADLGHKTLAVNLSDLAAMGAEPDWALLSLVLPEADSKWLEELSIGFFSLADRYNVTLVGGDTSYGTLNLTVTAGGWVPQGQALRRSGARIGDLIYVSGTVGDAALGLQLLSGSDGCSSVGESRVTERLRRPEPRILLGKALRPWATAVIDLSDGLAADLTHVVVASGGLGAIIEEDCLPLSAEALELRTRKQLIPIALGGGDDYELCFCVPPECRGEIDRLGNQLRLPLTMIGEIDSTPGIWLVGENGVREEYRSGGYRHYWVD
jgi:thiamine-monophosphate kinase